MNVDKNQNTFRKLFSAAKTDQEERGDWGLVVTIRRADVYFVHSKEVARNDQSPDVWEAAQKGIVRWEDIGELQDLVAGKLRGRTSPDQITLFNNNTGAGTQFAAVGSAVVKRARAMGLGKELPTEWFLESVSP